MITTINKVDDFLEAFPNKMIKHTGQPYLHILSFRLQFRLPTVKHLNGKHNIKQDNHNLTINKVDDFLDAFPNKIIKHTGLPDYKILSNIKTDLKNNFATVSAPSVVEHMAIWAPFSLQLNMPLPLPSTLHPSPTPSSQVEQPSFHPTAQDPK